MIISIRISCDRDLMNTSELQTLINEVTHRCQTAVRASSQLKGRCYLPPEIQCLVVEALED